MTTYDPNGLMDALLAKLQLKNDAALARTMEVPAPVLSKMRNNRLLIGATFVLRCVETAGMPLDDVRKFVPSPYVSVA